MSTRNHQAVTQEQMLASRKAKQKMILRVVYVMLVLSFILWAWSFFSNPKTFPVRHILVKGQYSNVNPADIKLILQPISHTGMLALNTKRLRVEFLNLPWVKAVTVSRHWPGALIVNLSQEVAVARWEKNGLITKTGKVFFPRASTISFSLPFIKAPTNLLPEAISMMGSMDLSLAAINLHIIDFNLNERQAVTLVLQPISEATPHSKANPNEKTHTGSIKVLLGESDMQQRLKRFIDIYPKVFEKRLSQVEYADMRYTNGMAVKWKQ